MIRLLKCSPIAFPPECQKNNAFYQHNIFSKRNKYYSINISIVIFYNCTLYNLILHNSKETHFYAVDMEKAPNKRDAFTQIVTIPHYDDISDKKKIDAIKKQTKAFRIWRKTSFMIIRNIFIAYLNKNMPLNRLRRILEPIFCIAAVTRNILL